MKNMYFSDEYGEGVIMLTLVGFGKVLGRIIIPSAKDSLGYYELKRQSWRNVLKIIRWKKPC
jgi:hypothetical protein